MLLKSKVPLRTCSAWEFVLRIKIEFPVLACKHLSTPQPRTFFVFGALVKGKEESLFVVAAVKSWD